MTTQCPSAGLLTYDQALEKVLDTTRPLAQEEVALGEILDRFLAQDVVAQFDLPRFDNSAVDGFGVRSEDVESASESNPVKLALKTTIHAGNSGDIAPLEKGETVKILTGAPVPPSVEAVIMREYCREVDGYVFVETAASLGENIRRRGDEVRTGDHVLPSGLQVTPPVVGLLAGFGYAKFAVSRQPRVAIVVTGDELVKPGGTLASGQIFESNSYALVAAVKALGLSDCRAIHALDTREAVLEAFTEALEHADVVVSAGGVSVGEHDFVKTVLEEDLKVNTVFWRVAIKPGKPVYFGYQNSSGDAKGRKLVFGLPGNPVSALVTFNLFVKAALRKMQRGAAQPVSDGWHALVAANMKKKAGRMDFVRGILSCSPEGALNVLPTRGQDSHMLSGLAKANCLIQFGADEESLLQGQCVKLEWLDWHS
ncbi:MAG: molybdopterin molybdotransferase MoeA [Candidatus Obscuribacterales bacterium]|nr:molybdopterin molybdotransferase MoeA [Candidatus Obscuribacterales bacterium]